MGILKLTSSDRKMTPKLAKTWLAHNTMDKQRPLRMEHVKDLRDIMLAGGFLEAGIAFAAYDGNLWVVNGQHTMHACTQSGVTCEAHVLHYQCDTLEDVWHLFSKFDRHKKRSANDIVRASTLAMDWLDGVPVYARNAVAGALQALGNGTTPSFAGAADGEERGRLLAEYKADALFAVGIIREPEATHLRKLATTAAIIATLRA